MDGFGTAAAVLEIFNMCRRALRRFQEITEDKRDISALRHELIAIRTYLQSLPEPPDHASAELSATLSLPSQSLRKSLDKLQGDIDKFLGPSKKRRHVCKQIEMLIRGLAIDEFYKRFIFVLERYQTESHATNSLLLLHIFTMVAANRESMAKIQVEVEDIQQHLRYIQDSSDYAIRTRAISEISRGGVHEDSANLEVGGEETLRRILGAEDIRDSQQRMEQQLADLMRRLTAAEGVKVDKSPTCEYTLFDLSQPLRLSGRFFTDVEVVETFRDVAKGLSGCLEEIGFNGMMNAREKCAELVTDNPRRRLLSMWKRQIDVSSPSGMKWVLDMEAFCQPNACNKLISTAR